MSRLKPRERDAIVQALRAGVVPKLGLRHIQVGRVREIEELVRRSVFPHPAQHCDSFRQPACGA